EGDRRPVLAAPQRRTVVGLLPGARLVRRVDLGPSRRRIESREDVLLDERQALDEVDPGVCALEKPEIAVARDVDEALDRAVVAFVVDQDGWRDLVPVPRVVRVVLEVPFDRSR